MANDQTFSYRLVKISLIILNALVIIGLTFFLLLIGHAFDTAFIIFIVIIGSNFVASIVGVIRESRLTVITTGSITLILLLLAVFNRSDRTQNSTFSLLYFLAIVMLSYAFSAMLKERQQQSSNRRPQSSVVQEFETNGNQFTAVVVYHPPQQLTPLVASVPDESEFKDPPPPYFPDDSPPPKYEEVVQHQK